ncbi:MAG: hypothetical protein ISR95_06795 [Candidatus Marinimicrobia bacterium]|nr:hypothetical protein [Candidatus Neomarinimicrobiota bacterium]
MRFLTSYIVVDSFLSLAVPTLRFGRQAYIHACPVVKNSLSRLSRWNRGLVGKRIGVISGFWS